MFEVKRDETFNDENLCSTFCSIFYLTVDLLGEIAGCMFHSQHGLTSFEHPTMKMKAMPRVDSEGVMCGANFKVDVQSRVHGMPRVGSEANWALRGSH